MLLFRVGLDFVNIYTGSYMYLRQYINMVDNITTRSMDEDHEISQMMLHYHWGCHFIMLHLYAMGQSTNVPRLNLKKLRFPASTTAITIILFPAFSAIKGLGLRGGADWTGGLDENAHGNKRRRNGVGWEGVGVTTDCGIKGS